MRKMRSWHEARSADGMEMRWDGMGWKRGAMKVRGARVRG